MKKYYISYKNNGIFILIMPFLLTVNGVLSVLNKKESDGFLGIVSHFSYIIWFLMAVFGFYQLYRIYKKEVYFEINDQKMIYSFFKRKSTYEYSDADSYIVKQSGKSVNVFFTSKETGKNKVISVSYFDVDSTEFMKLLSNYSKKDIYYKNYGEKQELFEVNDKL